ncbi:hypothetical protein [Allohahella marinimesophila]|uniref:Phage gp6-like head-tail connector protein n=1 Tax=Allohahella marinimesophila TaxID=1054972 RepID=A0ABP7PYP3_9GAMM
MKKNELIHRFKAEVLDIGPESSLPSNLSDEWLEVLLTQSEAYAEMDEDVRPTVLVAAVLHILFAKNGINEVSIEGSEIIYRMQEYSVELAIEEIGRKTEFKGNPATLETIFTSRIVEFSQ